MIYFSFFVSLVATIGSLYFSEVKGYVPCSLCWYQRIFMYPIPLLIFISILINDKNIKYYLRFFSLIGIIISSYHNFIQFTQQKSSFCGVTSSCLTIYDKWGGFITIPFMSLTAFIIIFVLSFFINDKVLLQSLKKS
ncbi:disulfide bond formation protein B [Bacillus cereus]|uniref:disulfide oxidoreductase n=1 Tax=Bacillus cereus group TaxID=86661 RepID=UPI000B440BD3|nr:MULTISPECIES: disulfide oxidoreductase [Bacillus cereus group]MBH0347193.1 disulfide bond formation protein DsbB [Bacillus thuringiensis]MED3685519.1 disulfide oxidoreductase [Bacillus thuringiensis]NRQ72176.1 disulfide bond formation protein B [Bacillus cereus]OTY09105.1 disulfide bond formation protein B [Bacillus thuringiensis serovar muju]